ncbi:MAG TPA: replicative DNA helicase [Clostridia bacterium]|jgi:replicative DNA helicase|nr:replicative DNA helicase [Clostridia bacterium]
MAEEFNVNEKIEENKKDGKPFRFPANIAAERSMLGVLLSNPDEAPDFATKMTDEYFNNPRNKKIFNAIKALALTSTVDPIVVDSYLTNNGLGEAGLLEYMLEIVNELVYRYNGNEYYKALHNDMILRRILSTGKEITNAAGTTADYNTCLDDVQKKVFELSDGVGSLQSLEKAGDASTRYIAKLDKLAGNRDAFKGLSTNYKLLDHHTGGLRESNLIILAARPSVGKSAFVTNIVTKIIEGDFENNQESDKVIAFFSLEMGKEEIIKRILSITTNITMNQAFRADFQQSDFEDIISVHNKLTRSSLYLDDTSAQTPSNIWSKCRRLKLEKKRLDLIVIDYLQLLSIIDPTQSSSVLINETAEITKISRQLKMMAMDLKCPVIALSQLRRLDGRKGDKGKAIIPKLSDLRQSGSIEQDADVVMFLAREDEEAEDKSEGNIILAIEKNRNGALKRILYHFKGENVRFTEIGLREDS